ncbi:MAG: alpha/beta hydrolase fold domain-containing protein [Cyclobacteriaceae bacterium]
MASLRSKIWQFFLNPLYSKKSKIGSKLNISLSRLAESPFPPAKISKKYKVVTTQEQGNNIFTIIPTENDTGKIILYLHGGAYIAGITWPHWRFIDKIVSQTGVRMAVVDYPIAPENNYKHVFRMLEPLYLDLLQRYQPSQIIFMGDSAGGGLAISLAQLLKQKGIAQPSRMILLSPWLDVTMCNQEISNYDKKDKLLSREALITAGKFYANNTERTNPLISPLYGDFDGLADIYLFMGTHDILVPDVKIMEEKIKNTTTGFNYFKYDHMFHVWMFYPIPEAKKTISEVVKIIVNL